VSAPRDERDVDPGHTRGGKTAAEVASDATGADDGDTHRRESYYAAQFQQLATKPRKRENTKKLGT